MEPQSQSGQSTRPRVVRIEDQILSILDEFEKIGFTQKEYCELSDINEVAFYSWMKKYRRTNADEPKGFVAVEVMPATVPTGPQLFAEDNVSYKMTAEQMMYMLSGMSLEDGGYVKAERFEPLHGSHM